MVAQLSIKKRMMVAVLGVFFASAFMVGVIAYFGQLYQVRESFKDMAKKEGTLFQNIIESDAKGLSRAHAGLDRIEHFLKLFADQKRDALLDAVTPVFEDIKKNNKITHMYFINPDGRVFLRAHRPDIYGDKLTRSTYLQSASTGEIADGIDLGQNFFSLRSVKPLYYGGKRIGYLEVAEEIDHVFNQMKTVTGNDMAIFLSSDYLSGKPTTISNEKIHNFTILDATEKDLTLNLAKKLGDEMTQALKKEVVATVSHDGKKYVVAMSSFKDSAGDTCGIIFSQKDITHLYAGMWKGIGFNILVFVLVLSSASLFLYFSLRRSLNLFGAVKQHILEVTTDWNISRKLAVDTQDEIGELGADFNRMTDKLGEIVKKVNGVSRELDSISRNVYTVSKQMVTAAERQAGSVQETSSAIMQINASINGVATSVDSLSLSAAESSSSILEMAASIEEVAINVETLSQAVEEVSLSIIEMTSSIKQIGHGVQTLMEASSTTASSIAQMDSSIRQVERNAMDAAAISEEVRKDAETGKAAVDAAINGMSAIKYSSSITSEVIENLSRRVNDIGTILSVIDEVAEQTNLLALNAAIIAAQAGEHGKGFAVVADEIKELAERTSSSTREIAGLIKGVQDETRRAVEAIEQADRSILEGEDLSHRSGEALAKIVAGVVKATDQVDEIARAAVEQAKGSHVIREAMEKVSDMVGQIAKATKEQTSGSELIMNAVERMKGLTAQVRNSAREQSKVGGLIARSTENITGMIDQIKKACDEQTRGSSQIVHAVEDIQQTTSVNLESVRLMDDTVASLSQQVELLQKEMSGFKV